MWREWDQNGNFDQGETSTPTYILRDGRFIYKDRNPEKGTQNSLELSRKKTIAGTENLGHAEVPFNQRPVPNKSDEESSSASQSAYNQLCSRESRPPRLTNELANEVALIGPALVVTELSCSLLKLAPTHHQHLSTSFSSSLSQDICSFKNIPITAANFINTSTTTLLDLSHCNC
jgi:hypothetical protein